MRGESGRKENKRRELKSDKCGGKYTKLHE